MCRETDGGPGPVPARLVCVHETPTQAKEVLRHAQLDSEPEDPAGSPEEEERRRVARVPGRVFFVNHHRWDSFLVAAQDAGYAPPMDSRRFCLRGEIGEPNNLPPPLTGSVRLARRSHHVDQMLAVTENVRDCMVAVGGRIYRFEVPRNYRRPRSCSGGNFDPVQ